MSLMNEGSEPQPLDTEADEFQRLVEPPAPPVEPDTPKRWPWLVAAIAVVAVVVAGGVWWLLSSTVSQDDYDEVVAELDAAELAQAESEQALSDSEASLSSTQQSLAESEQALADSEASLSSAEQSLEAAEQALSAAESDLASAEADLGDALETVSAYEDGMIGFWALAMEDGAGFDPEAADCIATEIVSSAGPEIMDVISESALSGAPPLTFMSGFFDAMDACGLAGDDLPPIASDAELQALREECAAGSGAACDDLFNVSPPGSDDELLALTCGGRYSLDEAPISCEAAMGT